MDTCFRLTKEGEKQLNGKIIEAKEIIQLVSRNKKADPHKMLTKLPTKKNVENVLNSDLSELYFHGDLHTYEITRDLYFYNRWYYSDDFYVSVLLKYKTHFVKVEVDKEVEIMPTAIIASN